MKNINLFEMINFENPSQTSGFLVCSDLPGTGTRTGYESGIPTSSFAMAGFRPVRATLGSTSNPLGPMENVYFGVSMPLSSYFPVFFGKFGKGEPLASVAYNEVVDTHNPIKIEFTNAVIVEVLSAPYPKTGQLRLAMLFIAQIVTTTVLDVGSDNTDGSPVVATLDVSTGEVS